MKSEFLPGTEIPLDTITHASFRIFDFENLDEIYEDDTFLKLEFSEILDLIEYFRKEIISIHKINDIVTGKTFQGKETTLNCLELVTLWTKHEGNLGSKVWIEIPKDWIPLTSKIKQENRKEKIIQILNSDN
jgi:hypothetical protein